DDAAYYEEDGSPEQASRLREAAFEAAQTAFISRGTRNGVQRLRLDAPEPERSTNLSVLRAVRAIEPLAADWSYLKGLLLEKGDPRREETEAKILRQQDVVGQSFVKLRDAKADVTAVLLPRPVPYTEVAKRLSDDEALLLIYAGPGNAYVFLATKEQLLW